MATDPGNTLFANTGTSVRSLPGSRCPLCRFPSQSLRKGVQEISPSLAAAVQHDFPEWHDDLGACERCLEAYAVLDEVA